VAGAEAKQLRLLEAMRAAPVHDFIGADYATPGDARDQKLVHLFLRRMKP
jgi:hypothetical protein